jgi:hypothetical protein
VVLLGQDRAQRRAHRSLTGQRLHRIGLVGEHQRVHDERRADERQAHLAAAAG